MKYKVHNFLSLESSGTFVNNLSIFDEARTGRIEPGLNYMRNREISEMCVFLPEITNFVMRRAHTEWFLIPKHELFH